MLTKSQVLKTLEELPDTFSPEELIERLLLLYELQKAIEQSDKGEVFDHEQIKKELLGDD